MVKPKELSASEQALAGLEEIAAREATYKLSPTERALANARKDHAGDVAKAQAAEAHRKLLARPDIAKAIKDLEALRAKLEWSPQASVRDIEAVEAALAQLSTEGSDKAVGLARVKEIFDARKTAMERRRDELDAVATKQADTMDKLRAELAELDPPAPTVKESSPKWEGPPPSYEDCDKLWDSYRAIPHDAPEADAARDKWLLAVDAFGGMESLHAEQAARKAGATTANAE